MKKVKDARKGGFARERRQAARMRDADGTTLMQAQDAVARGRGFAHWSDMLLKGASGGAPSDVGCVAPASTPSIWTAAFDPLSAALLPDDDPKWATHMASVASLCRFGPDSFGSRLLPAMVEAIVLEDRFVRMVGDEDAGWDLAGSSISTLEAGLRRHMVSARESSENGHVSAAIHLVRGVCDTFHRFGRGAEAAALDCDRTREEAVTLLDGASTLVVRRVDLESGTPGFRAGEFWGGLSANASAWLLVRMIADVGTGLVEGHHARRAYVALRGEGREPIDALGAAGRILGGDLGSRLSELSTLMGLRDEHVLLALGVDSPIVSLDDPGDLAATDLPCLSDVETGPDPLFAEWLVDSYARMQRGMAPFRFDPISSGRPIVPAVETLVAARGLERAVAQPIAATASVMRSAAERGLDLSDLTGRSSAWVKPGFAGDGSAERVTLAMVRSAMRSNASDPSRIGFYSRLNDLGEAGPSVDEVLWTEALRALDVLDRGALDRAMGG